MKLSVVVPVYNEEEVLPELLRRLGAVFDGMDDVEAELIFVDDGSADRSWQILEDAAAQDDRIRAVQFSRNFGHQAALSAGMDQVTGDAAVFMDADLQDSPEEIPRFIEHFRQGYDVVYAKRVKRKEALWLRFAYKAYYRVLNAVSGVRMPLDAGDFALLSRTVVDQIRAVPEHNRYLRGLRAWVGFRQVGLRVERAERAAGDSKYSLMRLIGLGMDGLFSFSTLPIRMASLAGAGIMAVSLLYLVYAVFCRLFLDTSPPGFTMLIIAVVFLGGTQLVFLGVLGEYVARVLDEVRNRPVYIERKRIGDDEES